MEGVLSVSVQSRKFGDCPMGLHKRQWHESGQLEADDRRPLARYQGEKTSIELDSNTGEILVNRLVAIQRLRDAILDNFDSVAADVLEAFPREFSELVWAKLRRAK